MNFKGIHNFIWYPVMIFDIIITKLLHSQRLIAEDAFACWGENTQEGTRR